MTLVLRNSGKPEFRVTPGSGTPNFGWLRENGTAGSRSHPDFSILESPDSRCHPKQQETIVSGDIRNSELRVTPGIRSSEWLREPGMTPGTRFSGRFREPRVTPGTRISVWLQEPVIYGFWCFRETGVPGESGNPPFRVIQGIRVVSGNPEFRVIWGMWSDSKKPFFRVTPGTLSSGWFREPVVLGYSGNPVLLGFRDPVVRGDFGNPEFLVNPGPQCDSGTRRSRWLREFGVPRDSGNTGWLRELVLPGDFGKPEWLRERGVWCDYGNVEFGMTTGTWSLGWFREPEVRATPGIRCSGWL